MRVVLTLTAAAWATCIAASEPVATSSIKRTQLEGAIPVTALTKEQVEKAGIADIGNLLSDGSSMVRFEIQIRTPRGMSATEFGYDLLIERSGKRQLVRLSAPNEHGLLAFDLEVDWGIESRTVNGTISSSGSFWVGPYTLVVRSTGEPGYTYPLDQLVQLCFGEIMPKTLTGKLRIPGPNHPLHHDAACGRAGERER